jgi:hypothetical protein
MGEELQLKIEENAKLHAQVSILSNLFSFATDS